MSIDDKTPLSSRFLSGIFSAIGSLPLGLLYGFADAVAFLAGSVFGYRRKVIRQNLSECFPEKSAKELRKIEKQFYHFLGDYFVETLRLGRMSPMEITQRMSFENFDELNRELSEGNDVVLYLGHYCNWEWVSSMPIHMLPGFPGGQIYHPLENSAADYAFLKIRSRFGAVSIKMKDTLAVLRGWRREKKNWITGFIADQVPYFEAIHYFARFLNHEAAAFTGPERLARLFNASVYYADISRPKRGYYSCRFIKITDNTSSLPQFEITQRYFDLLEESIKRAPQFWLWSHRRFKRSKEFFFHELGEEEANRRLSHL